MRAPRVPFGRGTQLIEMRCCLQRAPFMQRAHRKETEMYKKILFGVCAAAFVAGALLSAPAHAAGVKVGVLSCNVDSGWGYAPLACSVRLLSSTPPIPQSPGE